MGWDTGQYIQLIIVLGAGVVLFMATYLAPMRIIVWALLLLVPFQTIDSAYGSSNLVFTYMVGVSFLLRGRFVYLPLLGVVATIMFVYLLSFSQAPRGTSIDHILYMIMIISDFILFYIVYNYVRISGDYRGMWNILAVSNLLVLMYCVLEVAIGQSGIQLFGLSELNISSNRAEDGYISGPFRSVGNFGEYTAIQSLIAIYALMRFSGSRSRSFWFFLLIGNMGFMVASGVRGGIIALLIGLIVFMFLFRKEFSVVKMMTWFVASTMVFVIVGLAVVQYTAYNHLFEKFESTKFEGGIPDSRQGWFGIWDRVVEKPVIGHGPRLRLNKEELRRVPGHTFIPYPHNLYMYLVATIGLVGLSAYLWFFASLAREYRRGCRGQTEDPLLGGLPLLGFAILVLFVASQMRIEIFRFIYHDYQQYIFMLLAAFLAFSHLVLERKPAADKNSVGVAQQSGARDLLSRASKSKASVVNRT